MILTSTPPQKSNNNFSKWKASQLTLSTLLISLPYWPLLHSPPSLPLYNFQSNLINKFFKNPCLRVNNLLKLPLLSQFKKKEEWNLCSGQEDKEDPILLQFMKDTVQP